MSKTAKKKSATLSVGQTLNKELEGLNRTEFSARIGISRSQLYNILNDRRKITPDLAQNLGKLTTHGAKYWLNLQHEHQLRSNGLL